LNIEAAKRQMPIIKACAEKAGIGHALFPGYGTLLGLVREKGLIEHDTDTDFCVRADLIEPAQEYAFHAELEKAGLFEARRRRRVRGDNGRILWMSLKMEHDGCKSCIWFQWPWEGFVWHSKGKRWVTKIARRKQLSIDYDKTAAIAKGIPANVIVCDMVQKEFYGEKYNVPLNYMSCLDYWYPNWIVPKKGGSSMAEYYLAIGKWEDETTWKFIEVS
jgi:hypothetical protein